jgi:hypothetical protein
MASHQICPQKQFYVVATASAACNEEVIFGGFRRSQSGSVRFIFTALRSYSWALLGRVQREDYHSEVFKVSARYNYAPVPGNRRGQDQE